MSEFDKLPYNDTMAHLSEAVIILHLESVKENYFDKF